MGMWIVGGLIALLIVVGGALAAAAIANNGRLAAADRCRDEQIARQHQLALATSEGVEELTASGGYLRVRRAVPVPAGAGMPFGAGANGAGQPAHFRHSRPGGETEWMVGGEQGGNGGNANPAPPAQPGPVFFVTGGAGGAGGAAHAAAYPGGGYGGAPCWGGDPNLANGATYAPSPAPVPVAPPARMPAPAPAPVRPVMGCAQAPVVVGNALAAYTVDTNTGPQPGTAQWVTLGQACSHVRGCAACQAAAAPAITAIGGNVANLNAGRLRGTFMRPPAAPAAAPAAATAPAPAATPAATPAPGP